MSARRARLRTGARLPASGTAENPPRRLLAATHALAPARGGGGGAEGDGRPWRGEGGERRMVYLEASEISWFSGWSALGNLSRFGVPFLELESDLIPQFNGIPYVYLQHVKYGGCMVLFIFIF